MDIHSGRGQHVHVWQRTWNWLYAIILLQGVFSSHQIVHVKDLKVGEPGVLSQRSHTWRSFSPTANYTRR